MFSLAVSKGQDLRSRLVDPFRGLVEGEVGRELPSGRWEGLPIPYLKHGGILRYNSLIT